MAGQGPLLSVKTTETGESVGADLISPKCSESTPYRQAAPVRNVAESCVNGVCSSCPGLCLSIDKPFGVGTPTGNLKVSSQDFQHRNRQSRSRLPLFAPCSALDQLGELLARLDVTLHRLPTIPVLRATELEVRRPNASDSLVQDDRVSRNPLPNVRVDTRMSSRQSARLSCHGAPIMRRKPECVSRKSSLASRGEWHTPGRIGGNVIMLGWVYSSGDAPNRPCSSAASSPLSASRIMSQDSLSSLIPRP